MYNPRQFQETRADVLHELIHRHPLGMLVAVTSNGLEANHIPFEIDPEPLPYGTLRGHVARANPLWRDITPDMEVLVVFRGPDEYISPSWYPSKKESGKVVPTWNYSVVHAHGTLRAVDDRAWLQTFVEGLTNRYESGRAERWYVTDAPADYIEQMLGAIVGIEIAITKLEGKFKVSQNRLARDRYGTIEGLEREGRESAAAMAELVRRFNR